MPLEPSCYQGSKKVAKVMGKEQQDSQERQRISASDQVKPLKTKEPSPILYNMNMNEF